MTKFVLNGVEGVTPRSFAEMIGLTVRGKDIFPGPKDRTRIGRTGRSSVLIFRRPGLDDQTALSLSLLLGLPHISRLYHIQP
jgi:hypothetical protein